MRQNGIQKRCKGKGVLFDTNEKSEQIYERNLRNPFFIEDVLTFYRDTEHS